MQDSPVGRPVRRQDLDYQPLHLRQFHGQWTGTCRPTQPTVGVDFVSKTVNVENKSLRMQLWDTAGQERFHSLIPSYIKDSSAALIVFDITSTPFFMKMPTPSPIWASGSTTCGKSEASRLSLWLWVTRVTSMPKELFSLGWPIPKLTNWGSPIWRFPPKQAATSSSFSKNWPVPLQVGRRVKNRRLKQRKTSTQRPRSRRSKHPTKAQS